jgi:hypothetical protein
VGIRVSYKIKKERKKREEGDQKEEENSHHFLLYLKLCFHLFFLFLSFSIDMQGEIICLG